MSKRTLQREVTDLYRPSVWGQLYHSLSHNEALGGGSVGPGKTQVLLMDPLEQIVIEDERAFNKDHPHYHGPGESVGWALHLRRTMPQVEQTIIRSHKIFPKLDPGAKYDAQKHTWKFRSGYRFQFGHCKDPSSWLDYYSSEFTHLSFDELITFEEEQYDQIRTRVRTTDPVLGKMLKTRAMTNPVLTREMMENVTTKDPRWVWKRFVKPAPEGKQTLYRTIRLQDGTTEKLTRIYLPATLYDNPDKEFVRRYEISLRDMKPHMQQALLFGNWNVAAGAFFGDDWDPRIHVCKPFNIPDDWVRFRSMDWGYKLPGCIHWWAMDDEGNLFCERELYFQKMLAGEVAKRVAEVEEDLGLWHDGGSRITGPADTQLWEMRGSNAMSMAETFLRMGVPWVKADKTSRNTNAKFLLKRLRDHQDFTMPPGICFFKTCVKAIETIPTMMAVPNDPEALQDGGDDHATDSCLKSDTWITTWMGKVRLRDVGAGSLVLSTDGLFHRTNGSRCTRRGVPVVRVIFETGRELVGTPDHRIFCHDGVWRRLDQLDSSCYAFAPWIQSSLVQPVNSSTELDSIAVDGTSGALPRSSGGAFSCIVRFIKRTLGRFLEAMISITGTTTQPIMPWVILSRYATQSIVPGTFGKPHQPALGDMVSRKPEKRRRPGTHLEPGASGIGDMPTSPSSSHGESIASAKSAARHSWPVSPELGCVLTPAEQKTAESLGLTMNRAFALPAGESSWSTGSRLKPPVLGDALRIVSVTPAGNEDVWCLDVPGMGAFVAEDVVVSNCMYACAYASRGRIGIAPKRSTDYHDEPEPTGSSGSSFGYGETW